MKRVPEKYLIGCRSLVLTAYLNRWYSKHGYRKGTLILYNPEWKPEARQHERYRWVENPSDGLRCVGKVHEIRGRGNGNLPYFDRRLIDHNGWYIDNFQQEIVCGEVYQMPARNGKPVYVPAVSDPFNDAAVLDFHSTTDDLRDAIRLADSMAEWYAEDSREAEAKELAALRMEEITEEIATARSDLKTLCRELRANCDKLIGMEALRKVIRSHARETRRSIRALRAEWRKLEDNHLNVLPQW